MNPVADRAPCLINVLLTCLLLAGCKTTAPIHVWSPPELTSAVGGKIAIAPPTGDPKIAGPLHLAMVAHAPRDSGRGLQCIDLRSLQSSETIKLVSSIEGESSDIANVALARRSGMDFLLTGTIIESTNAASPRSVQSQQAISNATPSELKPEPKLEPQLRNLTVSWQLIDVRERNYVAGIPVTTTNAYAADVQTAVDAAAIEAWKIVTPHVKSVSVELAPPRLAMRRGMTQRANAAASQGDWLSAQDAWHQALKRHPKDHAALHNLAIAAVARQDFAQARDYIGQALELSNKPMYRKTAVWIETTQRDYHIAFGLPDPPTGWAATRR